MRGRLRLFFWVVAFPFVLFSCVGAGRNIVSKEPFPFIPYDRAFDLALKAANEMHEECSKINPINFPTVVSMGTSKSRGVITLQYRFDPEAGSLCRKPPEAITSFAKRVFVPHFGAEFFMHIRFIKEGEVAKGVTIEVTQMKGVKKEVFDREGENLKNFYIEYLRRFWK